MKVPKELVEQWAKDAGFWTKGWMTDAVQQVAQRSAEWALSQPALKEHTQQVINDPAEIRRVFEIDDAEYPPPDSGFMKL